MNGNGKPWFVIASPAQPGVAIQLDGLLRRAFRAFPRNDRSVLPEMTAISATMAKICAVGPPWFLYPRS